MLVAGSVPHPVQRGPQQVISLGCARRWSWQWSRALEARPGLFSEALSDNWACVSSRFNLRDHLPLLAMSATKSHSPNRPMMQGYPTLGSLRNIINDLFRLDSEFDAFCLDYFPNIKIQFSDAMTRTRKINVLFENVDISLLWSSLKLVRPDVVNDKNNSVRFSSEPIPTYSNHSVSKLGEKLRHLREFREEVRLSGESTDIIDQIILETRRQLRHGPQLQAGEELLDGRYLLLKRIGKGGFATVWLGYDRSTQQEVAVKILHSQWCDDSLRLERFYRGAKRMAQLSHIGIARVVAESREDRGFHFFVTEYVAGGDLRQLVQDHGLSPVDGLTIIQRVGTALHYAHAQGVIHRDIKPANILIGINGPLLTDFDLAWAADTTGGTNTGALGTFLYAAPEMMLNAKDVTPASDVYSLAMTIVFVFFGMEPIDIVGDRKGFLHRLISSADLRAVLEKATEREPASRFQSVAEFCDALSNPAAFISVGDASMPEARNRYSTRPASERMPADSNEVDHAFAPEQMIGVNIKGFRIDEVVGKGQFSVIYKATQVSIGKLAAVKFSWSEDFGRDSDLQRRFMNQARAVNRCRHPGIVDIFDFGLLRDGTMFLMMEFLPGITLHDYIYDHGGQLTIPRSISLVRDIAESLAVVHDAGIIHRNIKPKHIMVSAGYNDMVRVKVFDFGVAVLNDDLGIEREGLIIGTPNYMAPEQYLGSQRLSAKIDVYALGRIMVQMISGRPLDENPSGSQLPLRQLMPNAPRSLLDLSARMLAYSQSERPTMAAVVEAIRQMR